MKTINVIPIIYDDIVEEVIKVMTISPNWKTREYGLSVVLYNAYNISNNQLDNLFDFIQILQKELINVSVLPILLKYIRNLLLCSSLVMYLLLLLIKYLYKRILALSEYLLKEEIIKFAV